MGWPGRVEGFLGVEGPYPTLKLGFVRWGIFPRSTFWHDAAAATQANLTVELRSMPGQIVRITVNGEPVGVHRLESGDFETLTHKVTLKAGANVVAIDYELAETNDVGQRGRAALFRRMELTP